MSAPVEEVFLQPGQLYFGTGHVRVRTLLGSCVSITLWHPRRRIGGMCHYMLPTRGLDPGALDAKYADEALALLLGEIRRARTQPGEYVAKLFGGGNMFPGQSVNGACGGTRCLGQVSAGCSDVACKNIVAGRALLRRHGFGSGVEHVGGTGYRNLCFDLWSGDVWLRHHGGAKGARRGMP